MEKKIIKENITWYKSPIGQASTQKEGKTFIKMTEMVIIHFDPRVNIYTMCLVSDWEPIISGTD